MGMGNRNAANGSMIAGMGGFGCMFYNATGAASVTILSGTGIMYYGYGQVAEAGGE